MGALGNATNTELEIGTIRVPVRLYKTIGDRADEPVFDVAGPHGGRLVEPTVKAAVTDPLASQPVATGGSGGSARSIRVSKLVEEGYEDAGPVPLDEMRKGVFRTTVDASDPRMREEEFVDLTDDLARIDDETKLESMEVLGFIRRERVARERITGSYWLAPGAGAPPRPLKLIYEAMHRTGRVALVRWTKRTNTSEGILTPHPRTGALVVLELAWVAAVREPDAKVLAVQEAAVSEEEVAAAVKLIEALAERPDAIDEIDDERIQRRIALRENALAGRSLDEPVSQSGLSDDLVELFARAAR